MYSIQMPKRSSKTPTDVNQLAKFIGDKVTKQSSDSAPLFKAESASVEKNPAAVALGRLGGLKGGKARLEKLSPEKRSQIARKGAKARWAKHKKKQ